MRVLKGSECVVPECAVSGPCARLRSSVCAPGAVLRGSMKFLSAYETYVLGYDRARRLLKALTSFMSPLLASKRPFPEAPHTRSRSRPVIVVDHPRTGGSTGRPAQARGGITRALCSGHRAARLFGSEAGRAGRAGRAETLAHTVGPVSLPGARLGSQQPPSLHLHYVPIAACNHILITIVMPHILPGYP